MCGVFSRFILYSSNAQIFALERARQADEFLDSIGVNVHLHYNDTAYKEYERIIKPRLRESGIRHLRDG
ncbi:MAG TPA: hypothetical protein PKD31_21840, partial [Blastocatellia bacterium]|nr:hypothetical protein [Blastocatellia bacterium]